MNPPAILTLGARVHELILELNQDLGLTSVIVTHNLELVRGLDRLITLVNGKGGYEGGKIHKVGF